MVFEFLKGFALFVAPLKFVCVAKDLQWQHIHPIVTGFGVEAAPLLADLIGIRRLSIADWGDFC